MALLESCLCCNLLAASAVAGVYALVAYVVAFTIELWWILEAEVTLPAPAYLLCAGYFSVFILSAFLLHGLNVKKTLFLLGWLLVVAVFSFPEAGMVLFMSIHHWQVKSLYGLTELTYWGCRLICNIAGLFCVQSLYSTWKEEKLVMKRLHDLNLTSIIPDANGSPAIPIDNHAKNGNAPITYQNAGFVNSTNRLHFSSTGKPRQMVMLKRSASLGSNLNLSMPTFFGGSLPSNNLSENIPITPLNNVQYTFYRMPDSGSISEFNASTYDGIVAASLSTNIFTASADQLQPKLNNTYRNLPGTPVNKTQSLLDLSSYARINDVWDSGPPSHPVSVDYIDYAPKNLMTQSLDRRHLKFYLRARRASSLDELNSFKKYNNHMWEEVNGSRHQMPPDYYMYKRQGIPIPNGGSKRSLAESDDLQKYRDVAL